MEIITTSLGNTIEWLDFGLLIFMAPLIGAKMFPQQAADMATLNVLLVFSAGFICRPLGGIFFGHFGDTLGRSRVLRTSVLMITLSTLLVGVIPSYDLIGISAPILFAILRLMQGLAIGGEYSGVMIYLAESAPQNRRGFITSFAATSANLGFLLATLSIVVLHQCFTQETIADWAWRLPFIFAGIPGLLVVYYRFQLPETRVYSQLRQRHQIEKRPFIAAMKYAPYQLLKILGLTCMSSTFYYVFFGYMSTYLEHYIGFSLKSALIMQTMLLIVMLGLVPLAGLSGDYLSRKKMLIFTTLATMILVIPCFYLLQTGSPGLILLALMIAAVISSLDQGNSLAAVVENCPRNVRYSGIAFSYNLGMALFGGTAPIIITLLTEKISLLAPSYYLLMMASVSLIAATTLLGNNRYVP